MALACALLGPAPGAGAPGCEALAAFDASCARCHEAECSGRLTFAEPSEARTHVRRHAGALDDASADDLIELLRVTKEACRMDPEAAARCGGPTWDAARLRRVRARDRSAWFAPLGAPGPGPQRVALRFDRDTRASLRLATERFDVVLETASETRGGALEVGFSAPGGEALFLRVESDAPAELVELRLVPGAAPR